MKTTSCQLREAERGIHAASSNTPQTGVEPVGVRAHSHSLTESGVHVDSSGFLTSGCRSGINAALPSEAT
jgi:hypothetical protein